MIAERGIDEYHHGHRDQRKENRPAAADGGRRV